ncbi:MAG: tRNA (adenosine(37)-N6)-threonylcarbamoyltransferase complex dimerization subunit type 1 TsaB [Candidatus Saccharimonadales bacterium]
MYLLLDTSTATCRVQLVEDDATHTYEWQADREMAKGLLRFLTETVEAQGTTLKTLQGIGVFRGPGSFTGLRIGVATVNTLSQFAEIPIVGATGETWQSEALAALRDGRNDHMIVPEYGRPARITQPKK